MCNSEFVCLSGHEGGFAGLTRGDLGLTADACVSVRNTGKGVIIFLGCAAGLHEAARVWRAEKGALCLGVPRGGGRRIIEREK